MTDDDSADGVAEFFASARDAGQRKEKQSRELVEYWESLGKVEQRSLLLAEYRCTTGCELLSVFRMPAGRFFYKPKFKLRPKTAEETTAPAARSKHTSDGLTRWNEAAGSLDELIHHCRYAPDVGGLRLDCVHDVHHSLITAARLDADASGIPGPRKPIIWDTRKRDERTESDKRVIWRT